MRGTSLGMSVIAEVLSGENRALKLFWGRLKHTRGACLAMSSMSVETFGRVERRQSAFPCLCFLQRRAIASIKRERVTTFVSVIASR